METIFVTKVSIKKFSIIPEFGDMEFRRIVPCPLPIFGAQSVIVTKLFPKEPFRFKKIFQYLLQGLLVIAPLAITIYAIYWIVSTVDSWVPIFRQPITNSAGEVTGYAVKNYGLGFVIVIVTIVLIGYMSSFFIQSRIFNLFDKWLEKTPGVKFIYSSVRDFFGAFAGDKKKFDKSVLINVFSEDVWIIGFLTDDEMEKFDMGADHVSVYVPQAYNFAGQLYILPRNKVKKIAHLSSGEAMKYAVTGGVVHVVENDERAITSSL